MPKTQPAGQKTTSRQPATKKPATQQAKSTTAKSNAKGSSNVVTVKDIAAKVNMTPKALRSLIRRINEGPNPVGKGARYSWPSMSHPEVKAIVARATAKGTKQEKADA